MFGGIVETRGTIRELSHEDACRHLWIEPETIFDDLRVGDSVAVNGVCLTLTQVQERQFASTAVPETLALTNLGSL